MRSGRFVSVVGPSGAGKDTIIDLARAELAGDARFYFVRRLITRPPSPGEDHEPIDEAAFDEGEATGGFALRWRAHGLGYAVPFSAAEAVGEGRVVVCNLSRGAVPEARARFPTVVVVVTAPPGVLAGRIVARGRESGAAVLERLSREAPLAEADLVIENVGPPEEGADAFVAFLKDLAQ